MEVTQERYDMAIYMLQKYVAICDTASPVDLMLEMGKFRAEVGQVLKSLGELK